MDHGRVQDDPRVAQPETAAFPRHLLATLIERLKYALVQLPEAVLVGIGQGRALRRLGDSQVAELAFAAGQSPADLTQGLGLPELAEKHGHELSPAGEASGMAFGAVLADQLLKFQARKQLE